MGAGSRKKTKSALKFTSLNWAERAARIDAIEHSMTVEYEREIKKGQPKRVTLQTQSTQDLQMDEFYKLMGDFYTGAPRHTSPTRRLINQKHAAFSHKEKLCQSMYPKDYSLTYIVDPKRSFVVEPSGGEIDYNLAYKDPNKAWV
jgi:hypothetical protein